MNVVVCSVPKSGTYLVGQILSELGLSDSHIHLNTDVSNDYRNASMDQARNEPNRFLVSEPLEVMLERLEHGTFALSHLPPTTAYSLRKVNVIFLYRNLRDVVVSFCRWTAQTGRWKTDDEEWRNFPDGPAKLLGFLRCHGDRVHEFVRASAGWVEMRGVPRVSFESMMGDFGRDAAISAVRTIAVAAGRGELADDELGKILDVALAGETMTKSGARSDYRLYWNDRVEREYWKIGFGDANLRLGYSESRPRVTPFGVLQRAMNLTGRV